jgi:hypothetical protein
MTLSVCHSKLIVTPIVVAFLTFFSIYSHISLLCRMFRIGNVAIKRLSLIVLRNFSNKSPIGSILINSEDFRQTVDAILLDSKDVQAKSLILQTLLSIASKGEQFKAKLKNSTLNRQLKDQLTIMQSDSKFQANPENVTLLNLTNMLYQMLYYKEALQ